MFLADVLGSLRVIWSHPLNRNRKLASMVDYVKLQVGSRMFSWPVVCTWVNGTRIVFYRGDSGVIFNVCCGLDEMSEMAYVIHVADESDTFVDVGANVGQYAILACAVKGARGFCIEPIPSTFERLMTNIHLNNIQERVTCVNVGASDCNGSLYFTKCRLSTISHVTSQEDLKSERIMVPVRTLNSLLEGTSPTILKIDVEGYETQVIAGANRVIANPSMHSVIIELNGLGVRYGFDEGKVIETMKEYGYWPYTYDPFTRTLSKRNDLGEPRGNVLFIRNYDMVALKVKTAPAVCVHGQSI